MDSIRVSAAKFGAFDMRNSIRFAGNDERHWQRYSGLMALGGVVFKGGAASNACRIKRTCRCCGQHGNRLEAAWRARQIIPGFIEQYPDAYGPIVIALRRRQIADGAVVDAANDEFGTEYGYPGIVVAWEAAIVRVILGLLHNRADSGVAVGRNGEVGPDLEPSATVLWQIEFHVRVTIRVWNWR